MSKVTIARKNINLWATISSRSVFLRWETQWTLYSLATANLPACITVLDVRGSIVKPFLSRPACCYSFVGKRYSLYSFFPPVSRLQFYKFCFIWVCLVSKARMIFTNLPLFLIYIYDNYIRFWHMSFLTNEFLYIKNENTYSFLLLLINFSHTTFYFYYYYWFSIFFG